MNSPHQTALRAFEARLLRLLVLRTAVQWITVWLFVWGAVVLAARLTGVTRGEAWLTYGLAGVLPLVLLAGWRERSRRPEFARVRARYDATNACGGVLMAEETADMTAWHSQLPAPAAPALDWRSGRPFLLLLIAAAFTTTGLLLPDRLTQLSRRAPLEIGQLVQELQVEVQTLAEEKILPEKKAEDVRQQLAQLQKNSSALDPNQTWEALDHLKTANSDAAQQAAEEALRKLKEMSQAETLAAALAHAAAMGMNAETATDAAKELAAMIKAAKLEEGLLQNQIPPELLADLSGLNKEQMENLMRALQFNKSGLTNTVARLANLKLIDPAKLSQCQQAGQCPNPNPLAEYLSTCTNSCDAAALCLALCEIPGRGGVTRGRGDAAMTWKDESSAEGAKFKEQTLPAATKLADAQFVGVSQSAPELSGDDVTAASGALANAAAGGGAANAQAILPRHKQAVQNFFKREER